MVVGKSRLKSGQFWASFWRGHEVGDEVLIADAGLLSRSVRLADWPARSSLLLSHTDEGEACELARRLCTDIAIHQFGVGGAILHMTCGFSVAQLSNDDQTTSALLRDAAVAALYD
ncbi:MAG: PleD family two-component response regulator [Gammaproteobacteria bacterium]|jgi:PleD family two-component response regulator